MHLNQRQDLQIQVLCVFANVRRACTYMHPASRSKYMLFSRLSNNSISFSWINLVISVKACYSFARLLHVTSGVLMMFLRDSIITSWWTHASDLLLASDFFSSEYVAFWARLLFFFLQGLQFVAMDAQPFICICCQDGQCSEDQRRIVHTKCCFPPSHHVDWGHAEEVLHLCHICFFIYWQKFLDQTQEKDKRTMQNFEVWLWRHRNWSSDGSSTDK